MVDEHERISQQHGPGQREIDPIETAVLAPEREDNDDRESARHVARLGSERIGCIERKAERKEAVMKRQTLPAEEQGHNWQECKEKINAISHRAKREERPFHQAFEHREKRVPDRSKMAMPVCPLKRLGNQRVALNVTKIDHIDKYPGWNEKYRHKSIQLLPETGLSAPGGQPETLNIHYKERHTQDQTR